MLDNRTEVNGVQFHMVVIHKMLALFSVCEAEHHVPTNLPLAEARKWPGEKLPTVNSFL
jgi:hypothetical protein